MPTNGQYAVGELVTASDANNVFSRGNRNAIINGDFYINQRGFSNSGSGALSSYYGFDRWRVSSTGGGTWTTETFIPGNAIAGYEPAYYSRIVTSGQSGTSAYTAIAQAVEDVRTFAGQTTTLSFWAKAASGTPKIAIELYRNFGSGGSPSADDTYYAGQITLSTSWTRHTLQISVPSISGKTIGTTADTSYVALQMWVSAGSSFDSRTGALGIQSNTFDIWGVQWETGEVASPFQIPNRDDELMRCQRYYQVWSNSSATAGMTISPAWYSFPLSMATPMRKLRSTSISFPSILYGQNTAWGVSSSSVGVFNQFRPQFFTIYAVMTSGTSSYSQVYCTFNTHTITIDSEI